MAQKILFNVHGTDDIKELAADAERVGGDDNTAFYKVQSRHDLGDEDDIFRVGYTIANVGKTWSSAFKRAVDIINFRAPGVYIYHDEEKAADKQISVVSKQEKAAYCQGNVISGDAATITLGTKWPDAAKSGTALHELLHALGVHHEFKRNDREKFGVVLDEDKAKEIYGSDWDSDDGENWSKQYEESGENDYGITVFDPHSIMNYQCKGQFKVKEKKTVYWSNTPLLGGKRLDRLSPLDEVGLNLLYKPCEYKGYQPKQAGNGLFYCGRQNATKHHNYPGKDKTDGRCGPYDGANCAACRVLENYDIPDENDQGDEVWQGSSGLFYCGKKVGKAIKGGWDGCCGPNNGRSCKSCRKLTKKQEE